MSIFLTQEELAELTGCQKQMLQKHWLDKRSWKYEVSRLGKVKVLRKYAEMQMGIPIDVRHDTVTEPDFSSLAK